MTDQTIALLARLEQAAGSTEPDVVRDAPGRAIEEMEADVTERLGGAFRAPLRTSLPFADAAGPRRRTCARIVIAD